MKKYALFAVYGLMFLLFLFKMFYYREELYYVPDEEAHISYLAYIEENPSRWIPEFENMGLCEGGLYSEKGIYQYVINDRTCYLGHPPLYYRLIHLIGGIVTEESAGGHYVYVNLDRFKTANIYLTGLVMILIFYIGYTRLGKFTESLIWHGLYAAAAVSVPMLALCGSGITNDNLANLGVAVFMLGVLRYYEKKKGYLTYFLVAAGFFLSIMSKLTVGEFIVIMLIIIFIADVIRNKNLGLIWNRYFLATLPVYILAGSYFVILLLRYGSIQPGLDMVAPQEQSFVAEAERAAMTFFSYIPYFFRQFGYTWTGIYNGRFYDFKMLDVWEGRVFLWLLYAPFLFAAGAGIEALRKKRFGIQKKAASPYCIVYAAAAAGLFITIVTQFFKGYESFTTRGYMGGYQARYYLCDIPLMALAMAEGVYRISEINPYRLLVFCREKCPVIRTKKEIREERCAAVFRTAVKAIGIILIFLLLYGDFIYFLSVHNSY